MPGIWDRDDFKEGGMKGITQFTGKLSEVEEDVEGRDFGQGARSQLALHFYDVEIEESADEVALEDGKLTDWINQSSKRSSVNAVWVGALADFATANELDVANLPDCLYDIEMRFKRITLVAANEERGMSAGRALVPVEIIDSKPKKKAKKTEPVKAKKSKPAPVEDDDEDDEAEEGGLDSGFVKFVVAAVGEDGSTRDLIRRDIVKKAPMRKIMTEFGGLDTCLEYLVEHDHIVEDDGTYYQAGE